jgi:hypothetical protein
MWARRRSMLRKMLIWLCAGAELYGYGESLVNGRVK